ncbi:hypothetical protein KFE25_009609 [Diacronema lutheri]|uniref:Uncharacterized protein n=1 Tax=Diacronema lutheri TaxID=2081491 RepID=A0A8J6CKK4_DIALT|nr:hypothetical protein KFE25_009609 [Diacronema lutheri]
MLRSLSTDWMADDIDLGTFHLAEPPRAPLRAHDGCVTTLIECSALRELLGWPTVAFDGASTAHLVGVREAALALEHTALTVEEVWREAAAATGGGADSSRSRTSRATVVIIHAPSAPCATTVGCALEELEPLELAWFEALASPRAHARSEQQLSALLERHERIHRALIVLDSASEPAVLRSALCLSQLAAVARARRPLTVCLPARELRRAIADGFASLARIVAELDVSQAAADARVPAEAEALGAAVRAAGSARALEIALQDALLRPWLLAACERALAARPGDLRILGTIGRLRSELGDARVAAELNRRVLERSEQQLGWDHHVTTQAAEILSHLVHGAQPAEAQSLAAHARLGRVSRARLHSSGAAARPSATKQDDES